jgi:hypothetical protein
MARAERVAQIPEWEWDPLLCKFYEAGLFLPEEAGLKPLHRVGEADLSRFWRAAKRRWGGWE